MRRTIKLTETMLAPVGKLNINEMIIPKIKQIIDISPKAITKPLKLLTSFLAITAGNTMRPEISKVPIILIPITTVKAVKNDIKN